MAANQARQRYFDPSENTERKFVGLGQRVRTRFESLGHGADRHHQDDTNRGSNIRVGGRDFLLSSTNEEIRDPELSTTLPILCTLIPLIVSQGPISKCTQRTPLL